MNEQYEYRILYKHHKTGKVGFWEGWIEPHVVIPNAWVIQIQYASGENDSPQRIDEVITEGKQGRSIKEQAVFRLDSRTNSKIDSGYTYERTCARAGNAIHDALGRPKPMLAQKFRDYKKQLNPHETFVQLKYNGHRCLIMREGSNVIALSRNGKEIPGIPHILGGIDLPDGVILDGEIYRHGWKLQQIASAAKRYQRDSKELTYVNYDAIVPGSFTDRFDLISKLNHQAQVRIATTKLLGERSITDLLEKSLAAGYEGLILRNANLSYEIGRRSEGLLKVKQLQDSEFEVIDVLASKDGWGILVCKLPDGGAFKVSAPGTIDEKEFVLRNKDKFIGRLVTVEYSELTADNVPFHPVALQFRVDL